MYIYIMHCVLYGCYVDHNLYMDGVGWGGATTTLALRALRIVHATDATLSPLLHATDATLSPLLPLQTVTTLKSLKNCCDKKIMQQLC